MLWNVVSVATCLSWGNRDMTHQFSCLNRFNRTRAFTLIEMLVVITIISLMIAILLPAIKRAKEEARRIQCAAQEKQVLMALLSYRDNNNGWFPEGQAGTPTVIGGARQILEMLGGWYQGMDENDGPLKLLECPSRTSTFFPGNGNRVIYFQNSAYGAYAHSLHSTYMYFGGIGSLRDGAGNPRTGGGYAWMGWYVYGGAAFATYDDPYDFGPVPSDSLRLRHSSVGIYEDRMWRDGTYLYAPDNWSDCCSVIDNNHKDKQGDPHGGNVAFVDGHAEWRNNNITVERVHSYSLYRPMILY